MTRDTKPAQLTTRPTIFRWLGIIVGVVLTLLVALYVFTPMLISALGPHIAKRFGLTTLEISMGRPSLTGVDVKRLVIESDGYLVLGEHGRIAYSWSQLRERQIDRLIFTSVDVSVVRAGDDTREPGQPTDGLQLPSHPFQQLRVERLVIRIPDTGFVGEGSADIGADGLSLVMQGVEPAVASQFTLRATLSRDGEFDARFGERDEQAAEFLRLRGTLGDSNITLSGDFNLTGYPLRLVSAAAQLPLGHGTVAGKFDTQLAWPLPDTLVLSDIDATLPSIAIDWIADDKTLKLEKLTGSVTLAHGKVSALFSGDVGYPTTAGVFSAHLPADYRLDYEHGTISGADGARVRLTEADNYAHLTLRSFTFTPGIKPRAHVDGDLDIRVDDITVQGEVAGGMIDTVLKIDARLNVERKPIKSDIDNALRGRGSVTATLHTQVPSPWPETLSWMEWDADITAYTIDWKSADNALKLEKFRGNATLAQSVITTTTQGTAKYRSNGRDFTARFPNGYALTYTADRLAGGAGLTLGFNDKGTRANIEVHSFSLSLAPKVVLLVDGKVAGNFNANDTSGVLRAKATLDDIDIIKANGQLFYKGWIDTPVDRQDVTLDTNLRLRGNKLTATGELTTRHFAQLPFDLNVDTATQAGNLSARHTFNIEQPVAAALIKDWQEGYDLDGGKVAMVMNLSWSTLEAIAASITLDVSGGRAFYHDTIASGIGGRLLLHADDIAVRDSWRLEPSEVHIARIDMGLPIDDLRLGLSWSEGLVNVSKADAAVLGGLVRAAPFSYDLVTGNAKIKLALEKISLTSVLALEGDDLVGTGSLSGTLPVTINNRRVSIVGGQLVADSPGGALRLTSKIPSPTEQASLNFALNALRNFTYTLLSAQIDYAENGDLALAVQLQGRNPEVEKGRPIHYNLNVTENVPVLLQSLRLQKELTRRIEKKIIK